MDRYLILICTAIAVTPASILLVITIFIGSGINATDAIGLASTITNAITAIAAAFTAIIAFSSIQQWKKQLDLQNIRKTIDEKFIREVSKNINNYYICRDKYITPCLTKANSIVTGESHKLLDCPPYPEEEIKSLSNMESANKLRTNGIPKDIVAQIQEFEGSVTREIAEFKILYANLKIISQNNTTEISAASKEDLSNNIKEINRHRDKLTDISSLTGKLIDIRMA